MSQHPKQALRPQQAAAKLGISVPTLYRWSRVRAGFPQPQKLGERVTVFDEGELDEFLTSGARLPKVEVAAKVTA
jgi:predicted DNA-binding transcriptional regulator AlpA